MKAIVSSILAALAATSFAQKPVEEIYDSIRSKNIYEGLMNSFSKAKSVRATFEVQTIGKPVQSTNTGAGLFPMSPAKEGDYIVELLKPGAGRLQTPYGVVYLTPDAILLNGATYPVNPQNVSRLFSNDALSVFGMFFGQKGYKEVYKVRNVGTRQRRETAMLLLEVDVTIQKTKVINLYLEPKTNALLQAEFITDDQNGHRQVVLLDVKNMVFDPDMTPESLRPKPDGQTQS